MPYGDVLFTLDKRLSKKDGMQRDVMQCYFFDGHGFEIDFPAIVRAHVESVRTERGE